MADYFAVLNRTLSGFSDPKPALRDKLYERARGTIRKQLDMRRPTLDDSAIDAEMAQLEEAIVRLEEGYRANEAAVGEMPPEPANAEVPVFDRSQPDPQPVAEAGTGPAPADVPIFDPAAANIPAGDDYEPQPVETSPAETQADYPQTIVDPVNPEATSYAGLPEEQIRQDLSLSEVTSSAAGSSDPDERHGADKAASPAPFSAPAPDPAADETLDGWASEFLSSQPATATSASATDGETPLAASEIPVFDPPAPTPEPMPESAAPPPPPAELPPVDSEESLSIPAAPAAEPPKARPAKRPKLVRTGSSLPTTKIIAGLVALLIVLLLIAFFALPALKPLRNSTIETLGLSGVLGSVLDLDDPARPTPVKTITITPQDDEPAPAPEPKSEDRLGEDGSQQSAPTPPAAGGLSAPEGDNPAINALPALAPGQSNAILYEEGSRGNSNDNTLNPGTISWTLGSESVADGLPEEPVISGRMDIPSRDLVLLLSIKRNVDEALPASHVIELVFATPDDFPGGAIANINRFVLKESEQSRGDNLVGVPARIDDGIFLIALNNLEEARTRNVNLLRTRSWIDIPLEYRTGRRALVTLEKGETGQKIFADAFSAWDGLSG